MESHFRIRITLVIEFIVQHIAKLNLQQIMFSLGCELEFMSTVILYSQSRHLYIFLYIFSTTFLVLLCHFD